MEGVDECRQEELQNEALRKLSGFVSKRLAHYAPIIDYFFVVTLEDELEGIKELMEELSLWRAPDEK
jgi:hypothetical protein